MTPVTCRERLVALRRDRDHRALGGYSFPASFVAFSQFVITWIAGAAVSAATAIRKRWPSGLGAYCHRLFCGTTPTAVNRNSATGTPALMPPRLSACMATASSVLLVSPPPSRKYSSDPSSFLRGSLPLWLDTLAKPGPDGNWRTYTSGWPLSSDT